MDKFTTKYADSIGGVLSGFDRLVFRGTLRQIAFVDGLHMYLAFMHILIKDFTAHALHMTGRIKEAWSLKCQKSSIETRYLTSAAMDKEAIARQIAAEKQITKGPICLLSVVEPCQSFEVHSDKQTKKIEIFSRERKCLHLYYYCIHPIFGFMNARIQTWFPFNVQICINGREWLSRQMDAQGMSYERQDNCFVWVDDFKKAQALLNSQLEVDWPCLLNDILKTLNPVHDELFGKFEAHYYWSVYQSEWATDIVFKDTTTLQRLYPMFIRHGISTLNSTDVMRFLGRRLTVSGSIPGHFNGEVTTSIKAQSAKAQSVKAQSAKVRTEGVRIKHQINKNSVKLYDKAYTEVVSLFRIETTMNNPGEFKAFRPKEGGDENDRAWRKLRKGVADLHRRAEISQRINERYLDALASIDDSRTLEEVTRKVIVPTTWHGKRVRALRPFDPEDLALFEAVSRGEFILEGFRNADLQRLLYKDAPASVEEAKRRASAITRKLRLLRAHGIIQKIPHSHRYQVTRSGRTVTTAILTARQTPVNQLLPKAA